LLLEIPAGISYAHAERRRVTTAVQHDALALAFRAEDALERSDTALLQHIANDGRRITGGAVVITDRYGATIAQSGPSVRSGTRSLAPNPGDIRRALANHEVTSTGHAAALGGSFLSVAEPITIAADGGTSTNTIVGGVARVAYPLSGVDARIRNNWLLLAVIAVAVLVIVFAISLSMARSVTRPVRKLETAADRLGRGELATRAPVPEHPAELRVLAESFNRTASRLERLVESQQSFIADASHQLRTPLAALRLRLENVQQEAGPASTLGDDLDGALSEVARLSRIVDGLMELARAERMTAAPDDVDVGEVVHQREASWSAFAGERGVRISVSVDGRCIARATPGRLDQVLDNVLNNALDVAPSGSDVSMGARDDGEWVLVQVADAGPGLSDAAMTRAFDRFWREAHSRDGGSGLGLAIVQELVRSDGGNVSLSRSQAGGLEVTVRLPAAGEAGGGRGHEPAAASGRRWPTRVRPTRSANV
ncbi:MAG: HAMP domain-containing histidine kinase, partial [Actinobacteria bacterium]|nr:HAMP domain-containing histidine kinase [Actinomycetota bacterium]